MLPNYQNILIATDLTPNSEHAFKHAILLSGQSQAQIHLLHVVPEIDAGFRSYIASVMGEGKLENFEAQHENQARTEIKKELEEFVQLELAVHPEYLKKFAGVEVVHGYAVDQILKYANKINADIIVMGTHGKGVLSHTFLGSVAEKVLVKSKIPVFVIPIPD